MKKEKMNIIKLGMDTTEENRCNYGDCEDRYDCCDCGTQDSEHGCGCSYCWSCNACDSCKEK